jgi:hypothetical protein
MTIPTFEAVVERLDGLERENRRLRWAAGVLLVGMVAFGAIIVVGSRGAARTVVAEKLVIRDSLGRVRGSFGVDRDGLPSLKVFDRRGIEQIELGVPCEDMSVLAFSDRGGNRARLETSIEGATTLRLFDDQERIKASLYIRPDGVAGLSMAEGDKFVDLHFDGDGRPAATMTVAHGLKLAPPPLTAAAGSAPHPTSEPSVTASPSIGVDPSTDDDAGGRHEARGASH